jgi:hypothetical protein
MNNVKTFEEFWPFASTQDPTAKNKKTLIGICDYLYTYCTSHQLLDYKVQKVEVGHSKKVDKAVIQIVTTSGDILRFSFKIDSNFMILDFESYYILRAGEIMHHSSQRNVLKSNQNIHKLMEFLLEKINYYFKLYKLFLK